MSNNAIKDILEHWKAKKVLLHAGKLICSLWFHASISHQCISINQRQKAHLINDIFIQIPDLCTLQKWIKKAADRDGHGVNGQH